MGFVWTHAEGEGMHVSAPNIELDLIMLVVQGGSTTKEALIEVRGHETIEDMTISHLDKKKVIEGVEFGVVRNNSNTYNMISLYYQSPPGYKLTHTDYR